MYLGFQQITAATSAATTLTVPSGAYMMQASAETGTVRLRLDGTAPTSSVGLRILHTMNPVKVLLQGATPKAISGSSVAGKLNVEYFG